jgi:hypothetical protein
MLQMDMLTVGLEEKEEVFPIGYFPSKRFYFPRLLRFFVHCAYLLSISIDSEIYQFSYMLTNLGVLIYNFAKQSSKNILVSSMAMPASFRDSLENLRNA